MQLQEPTVAIPPPNAGFVVRNRVIKGRSAIEARKVAAQQCQERLDNIY
jgi:hypothetical protein